jgi:1-acyl-sn-glycerol-3-phosphate acyltransferase
VKYIAILPRVIWKTLFVLNFVIGLIVLYPVFYILLSKKKWYPKAFSLMRFWARWIVLVPGIKVSIITEISSGDHPPVAIYCANHVSYLDIVLSYIVVPQYFVFMGKQEIQKAPLFNIFFRDMNILVDRQSRVGSHKAYLRASDDLRRGISVFLFPEGTISSKGKLLSFKNGAFKLAIDNQVPVVPVTYLNNWKLLQNGGFLKSYGKPGVARVIVHKPVPTTGMTEKDLVNLRSQVYHTIEAALKEHENRRKNR